jgi:bifunctional UDP-N-acetylglucosamine pyrophosphorylase / glucosamine-1-phosphate N-acetyltransferase
MPQEIIEFAGLVLAAGMGKRLRTSETDTYPKVLREVNGRPMIAYVLDALRGARVNDIWVVVGVGAGLVEAALGQDIRFARQERQLGSGDAVASAKTTLMGRSKHVVVMCGDSPLFKASTVSALKAEHLRRNATITLASATVEDPTGYGRIIRQGAEITGVVEEKCASPDQKAINEVNGGCYAFDSAWMWANIDRIKPNDAGEICLTDLVQFAIEDGRTVTAVHADPDEILGVNTPEQLRQAEEILRRRVES